MTHWSLARILRSAACLALVAGIVTPASSAVSQAEADKLKSTLTPLGGERAGSADGLIPPWTGTLPSGFTLRSSPFDNEAPVVTITAANMQQYADRLTDGMKALLQKYPDFKIIVYPTHRTATAPQWMYAYTYQNALKGQLNGTIPTNVYGGVPFPIPQSGAEVMWNHLLRWRPPSLEWHTQTVLSTADGRHISIQDAVADQNMPYYFQGDESAFRNEYWMIRLTDVGPPLHAGEQILGRESLNDDDTRVWINLVGQRRTREVPNACCDTPNPGSTGIVTFDEIEGFTGRISRYDWKILGKREMYIPYNSNISNRPSDDFLLAHFVNPNRVRWELHRVWVIEATLRPGQRHEVPRARFYVDEDSWDVVLADRWDAHNQLWKVGFTIPYVDATTPAVLFNTFGQYDLEAGTVIAQEMMNAPNLYARESSSRFPDDDFTPQAMLRSGR